MKPFFLTSRKLRTTRDAGNTVRQNSACFNKQCKIFLFFLKDGQHGKGGDITIREPDYIGMAEIFVQAATELGYPHADLNGNYTDGFDVVNYPIKNGRRFGVYGAMINAIRTRPTLTIRKFSMVKRILIDNNNRAYGVEYERHGHEKRAYSNKEVIVSAGIMNSPKILMLSGVGPREHLEGLDVIPE